MADAAAARLCRFVWKIATPPVRSPRPRAFYPRQDFDASLADADMARLYNILWTHSAPGQSRDFSCIPGVPSRKACACSSTPSGWCADSQSRSLLPALNLHRTTSNNEKALTIIGPRLKNILRSRFSIARGDLYAKPGEERALACYRAAGEAWSGAGAGTTRHAGARCQLVWRVVRRGLTSALCGHSQGSCGAIQASALSFRPSFA